MPLDIQPLSPQRRALMVMVLLVLLGASMGFAQWLVMRRQSPKPHYLIGIHPPPNLVEPVKAYDDLEGCVLSGQGLIDGKPRRFAAFSYDTTLPFDVQHMEREAATLFGELSGAADVPVKESQAVLGRYLAVNLEGELPGDADAAAFLFVRLAVMPGHVVAICYSGPGRYTDGDRTDFEAFCGRTTIVPVRSSTRK